jgi:hypothetical protein
MNGQRQAPPHSIGPSPTALSAASIATAHEEGLGPGINGSSCACDGPRPGSAAFDPATLRLRNRSQARSA